MENEEVKLTPKQRKFKDHYLADPKRDATKAAIAAGYSEKTAHAIGYENLNKPYIKELIEQEEAKTAQKLQVTKEMIILRMMEIMETGKDSDSIRAGEVLNKMLGFNSADKQELTVKEQPLFGEEEEDGEEQV